MNTVYSLRDDPQLKYMQDMSLSDSAMGLRPTPAVIGSDEWWRSIESGVLPTYRVEGNISGYWPGQYGQGPAEFNLQEDSGTTSNWGCGIDPADATRLFRVGRRCTVEFVEQELKTAFQGRSRTAVAIRIAISGGEEEHAA